MSRRFSWIATVVIAALAATAGARAQGIDPHHRLLILEPPPEPILKVAPQYPPAARRAGIEGLVVVHVLVGADGRVKDTRIIRSIPALDRAAVECVRRWVFKPALDYDDKPTPAWTGVPIRFSLPHGRSRASSKPILI